MTVHIADWEQGRALYAFDRNPSDIDGRVLLGTAARTCVVGSRGQSWYWAINVGGEWYEARRKPEARAELIRLCEARLAEGCVGHARTAETVLAPVGGGDVA